MTDKRTDDEIVEDWLERLGARLELEKTAKDEHTAAQRALTDARARDTHPRGGLVFARDAAADKLDKRRDQVAEARRVLARHRDDSHVASPVARILQHSNDWAGSAHDGVDLICPPAAVLFAICDAVVIDVRSGGWWGKGAVASGGHAVSEGDGIIQIKSLVEVGPFKRGLHFGYGHAEGAMVKVGQKVKAGQAIGRAGFARAWHPHFMCNGGGTLKGIGTMDPWPFIAYALEHED